MGSHPVADSIGKADNEGMSVDDVLTRVAQITRVGLIEVFGVLAARLIEGLLRVGPVGLKCRGHRPLGGQARPGRPASFGPLGVSRISFGPFLQDALAGRAKKLLARWG